MFLAFLGLLLFVSDLIKKDSTQMKIESLRLVFTSLPNITHSFSRLDADYPKYICWRPSSTYYSFRSIVTGNLYSNDYKAWPKSIFG